MEHENDLELIDSNLSLTKFKNVIDVLKGFELVEDNSLMLNLELLLGLSGDLIEIMNNLLISRLNDSNSDTLDIISLLIKNKTSIGLLLQYTNKIEGVLSHILDLLELSLSDNNQEKVLDCNSIFDIIENCTKLEHKLKRQIDVIKPKFEVSIEFDEILNDHMGTLESLIEKKIQETISIQDDKFSSPIRHVPSFTLSEIIDILDKNNYLNESKIPTFSSLEESIVEKYLELKNKIIPIELSLTDVLTKRIENFKNRGQDGIDELHAVLLKKFKLLMDKYRFLVDELRSLKLELIDRRWNMVFISLNNELSFLLGGIDSLQKKIFRNEGNSIIKVSTREKLISQLDMKSRIVTKTFNVIYRAFEFSLVDAGTSTRTNDLAKRWLELRPINDKLILVTEDSKTQQKDNHDIIKLTEHLNKLSLKTEIHNPETNNSKPFSNSMSTPKKKIGAALLKKMNIKPIIITGTPPPSVEKHNPFFKKDSEYNELTEAHNKEVSKRTDDLNESSKIRMDEIPSLKFVASAKKNKETIPKSTIETDEATYNNTIKELEFQKIEYFSKQKSRIPAFNFDKSTKTLRTASLNVETARSTHSIAWSPFTQSVSAQLKSPTPKVQLLSTEAKNRSVTR